MILQTNGSLRSLLALMLPCLAKPHKDDKDERVISLGLHIVRNLLSIKDAVASDTTTGQKEEMSRMQVCAQPTRSECANEIVKLDTAAPQAHVLSAFPDIGLIGGKDRNESV